MAGTRDRDISPSQRDQTRGMGGMSPLPNGQRLWGGFAAPALGNPRNEETQSWTERLFPR